MPPGVPTGSMRPPPTAKAFRILPAASAEFIPTLTDCRHLDHLLIVGHQGVLSLLTALLLRDASGGDVALSHCPWRPEPPRNPRRFHHPAGIK